MAAALSKRWRVKAEFLALAVGSACVLNLGVEWVFARDHPTLWHSIAPEFDYGFPSGYSMLLMTVVASLLFLLWNALALRL